MSPFKFVSILPEDETGFCTVRPHSDLGEDWGQTALTTEGFQGYCNIDAHTDAGLAEIAVFNKYVDEWSAVSSTFTNDTPMVSKIWRAFNLYVDNRDKRLYHLEPKEGGHRRLAIIQAELCSPVHPETASVSKPQLFRKLDFQKAGLEVENPKVSDLTIVATQNAIVEGTETSAFFSERTVVKVSWIQDFKEPVRNILNACTILSENLSKIKRESVRKDAFSVIGTFGSKFLKLVETDSLMHRPDFSEHTYKGGNKFPPVASKKELQKGIEEGKDVPQLLPMYSFLYSDVFGAYCEDPFDVEAKKAFLEHFRVPVMTEGDVVTETHIRPPFLVSWKSMACDASLGTSVQRVTSEMVNKWLFLPPIMHHLYAAQNNMQIAEASKTKALHDIVRYTMRHHVHQFGMLNCKGQPCMLECYKIPYAEIITSGAPNIIGAALFVAETFNAALNGVQGLDADGVEVRQARLDAEASSLAKMYDTISSYSSYPSVAVCLESLGKVDSINPFFHGISESTYDTGFSFIRRNDIPCRL